MSSICFSLFYTTEFSLKKFIQCLIHVICLNSAHLDISKHPKSFATMLIKFDEFLVE